MAASLVKLVELLREDPGPAVTEHRFTAEPAINRVAGLAGPVVAWPRSRLLGPEERHAWCTSRDSAGDGVGRRRGIGAGLALGLADDGWDLVLSYWAPYDDRVSYARGEHDTEDVAAQCRRRGSSMEVVAADLAEAERAGGPG